jgi:tetratricopeptide (TPR) repeat protein
VDDTVANRLLNDAGHTMDQLPLIQHCLMWMWSRAKGREPMSLSDADYQDVGGFAGALSRHADQAYEELSGLQQHVAQVLFRALTEWVDESRQVRHPSKLEDVAKLAVVSWEEVGQVVEVFRQPGRSFLTPDAATPLAADTMIDISHESLIRQWDKLKGWSKDEAELARHYRRLEDRAQEWDERKAVLLHSLDLDNALAWERKATPTAFWAQRYGQRFDLAMEFLQASKSEAEKEVRRKRRRRNYIYMSVAFIIVFVGLLSFFEFAKYKVDILANKGFSTLEKNNIEAEAAERNYLEGEAAFKDGKWWDRYPKIEWTNYYVPINYTWSTPELYYGTGLIYESKMEALADNIKELKNIEKNDLTTPEYKRKLEELANNKKEFANKVEKEYKEAIDEERNQKDNETPKYLLSLAEFYFNNDKPDKGMEKVDEIDNYPRSKPPDKARAYRLKGDYHYKQGMDHAHEGKIHLKKDEFEKAHKAYKEGKQKYKPKSLNELAYWHFDLSNDFLKIEEDEKAIQECETITGDRKVAFLLEELRHEQKVNLYLNMGLAYARQDKEKKAKTVFKKAIDLIDRSEKRAIAQTHQDIGNSYGAIGKYDQAIQSYNNSLRYFKLNDPQRAWVFLSLASAYFKKDDRVRACKNRDKAKDIADSNPKLKNNPKWKKEFGMVNEECGITPKKSTS